ncbi:hypothetical protein [Streptomyces uncialis]|uniref:hypothetical protein n=1 Tax=Streptomyces uncialis TaxID=1048205 RepID=UPI003409F5A6
MRTRTTAATAAALLLAALTACSSDSKSTAESKPGAKPSSSPEATSAPSPDVPLAFGTLSDWKTSDGTEGTTTVLDYKQPVTGVTFTSTGLGYTDPEWAYAEVKVCNKRGTTITVSQAPWSLGLKDGGRITPHILDGPGLPQPQYPTQGAKVKAGGCVRGKVPVIMEKGARPDRVIYETADEEPVEWAVPAK